MINLKLQLQVQSDPDATVSQDLTGIHIVYEP